MRGQTSPAHGAGEEKLIEPLGIVVRYAPAQYLPLPGIGGNFKTLQLPQHLKRCALASDLGPGRDMLPAQEPAHELRRGNGLNLLPQSGNREPVNTRQQATVAPFRLRNTRIGEFSAQNATTRLEPQERLFDLRVRQTKQSLEACCRHRTQML